METNTTMSQRHPDEADAVLDAFVASGANPNDADLEDWLRRFPEYEQDLRRFAASWALVQEMATEPDPNGPGDDVLVSRGAEIVGEMLGQLGSINRTVAGAMAGAGEAPVDGQEQTIQRYEQVPSGATHDAQGSSTMLDPTVENEFEEQTSPTQTAVSGGGPGRPPVRTRVGTVPQPGLPERLKILLVDQNPQAIAGLRRTLNDFDRLEVVGDAGFGPVASTWAHTLEPAVILVAVEEPVARALTTIQSLTRGSPLWTVMALVGQFDRDVFRRAVLAGARDVVSRTASSTELRDAIIEARRADSYRKIEPTQGPSAPTGTIITVFGVKGGIGKTTIATNLATALASETSASVALVDLNLPFGDIALMLDLRPDRDVVAALEDPVINDLERLQASLVKAPQGIHVLAAPTTPGIAAHVDPDRVGRLLQELAELYQFVIVDTPVGLTELTAVALDVAELGLFVTTPEVPSLKRTQGCMRLLQQLDFPIQKV
ncbi:MAG: AAA family ATPase, partial [Chloroflexi bacterium]|nr:AAA family ATPase [Chloroflexota bacterium]